jgi:isoquinoline 1-oxidoreductase subunit beta
MRPDGWRPLMRINSTQSRLAPSRRTLLRGTVAAASCLIVGFDKSGELRARQRSDDRYPFDAYLSISPDSVVTILSAHLEMGQGIHHGIATLVQEELRANWTKIRVEHGWGNPEKYADIGLPVGFQSTGAASGSIYSSWDRYRRAGAAARAMLVNAASLSWAVPSHEIEADEGILRHPSGKVASYGAFAIQAASQPPPKQIVLRERRAWRYIGNQQLRPPGWDLCPNLGQYTSDVSLPGLLTAVMVHPPRFGAKLKMFEANAAKEIPGVVAVVAVATGVAVVAKGMWAALKATELVDATWDFSEANTTTSTAQMEEYRKRARDGNGRIAIAHGDSDKALKEADKIVETTYETPYLAHAALEPLNAVVQRNSVGQVEIWTANQLPDFDIAAAARTADVAPKDIVLHVRKAGGSFGRRMSFDSDIVVEAVSVAKAIDWKAPVKLQWTREDDMGGGRYKPAFVHHVRTGLDKSGDIVAWQSALVGESIFRGTLLNSVVRDGIDPLSIDAVANTIYGFQNFQVTLTSPVSGIPVHVWRGVGATHGVLAVECHIDELAVAAGVDPLIYRLRLLRNRPRLVSLLELVAQKACWRNVPSRSHGVAVGRLFETTVAQIAEISLGADNSITVHKVVCAVDCGIAVNPDKVAALIEGGIGFGLGAVLTSRISFIDGLIQQHNFDTYKVLRFNQMPQVEVHVLPSEASPRGVAEVGLLPLAPAVLNAVLAATGRRHRTLPISS